MNTRLAGPAVVLAASLAACSTNSATLHGRVTPASALPTHRQAQVECTTLMPSPGTQVTVADPGGKIIGTGDLGTCQVIKVKAGYRCAEAFTVTGLPAEPRYGLAVSGIVSTLWIIDVHKPITFYVGP